MLSTHCGGRQDPCPFRRAITPKVLELKGLRQAHQQKRGKHTSRREVVMSLDGIPSGAARCCICVVGLGMDGWRQVCMRLNCALVLGFAQANAAT